MASRSFRSWVVNSSSVTRLCVSKSRRARSRASRSSLRSVVHFSKRTSNACALSLSDVIITSKLCTVSSMSSCEGVCASGPVSESEGTVLFFPTPSLAAVAPRRSLVSCFLSAINALHFTSDAISKSFNSTSSTCNGRLPPLRPPSLPPGPRCDPPTTLPP